MVEPNLINLLNDLMIAQVVLSWIQGAPKLFVATTGWLTDYVATLRDYDFWFKC